ncbi:MAG: hydrogenase expression/formation protein HypE, partial [Chlorobi bacterium]|nr:hydrogenase expression/formation protein HypE [Chlorobiota bacterium]
RAACEMLGLDPLYSANEGVLAAVVAPGTEEEAVHLLRQFPEGRHAAVIGEITEGDDGVVVLRNALGGKRVVMMPVGEQLPRIC